MDHPPYAKNVNLALCYKVRVPHVAHGTGRPQNTNYLSSWLFEEGFEFRQLLVIVVPSLSKPLGIWRQREGSVWMGGRRRGTLESFECRPAVRTLERKTVIPRRWFFPQTRKHEILFFYPKRSTEVSQSDPRESFKTTQRNTIAVQ